MSKIRKINVSEIEGRRIDQSNSALPYGTLALYEEDDKWKLRIHDGETDGGEPIGDTGDVRFDETTITTVDESDIQIEANVKLYGGLEIHSAGEPLGTNDIVFFDSGSEVGRITTQGETGGAIQLQADIYFEVKVSQDDGGEIETALWEFGSDGILKLPGNGNYTIGETEPGLFLSSSFGVAIFTDVDDDGKAFIFGADGDLTTPGTVLVGGVLKIDEDVHEQIQTKVEATGTVEHDCSAGHIFYHTSPSANWTVNLTNLDLSSNYATAVTIVIVQGATGYYPESLQINGNGQTIEWQGGSAPTPGTERIDVVTFSIINNSGTFIVLGQLTGF